MFPLFPYALDLSSHAKAKLLSAAALGALMSLNIWKSAS